MGGEWALSNLDAAGEIMRKLGAVVGVGGDNILVDIREGVEVSGFGEVRTSELLPVVQHEFATADGELIEVVTGTGSTGQASRHAFANSGTNGYAILHTRLARYRAGQSLTARFTTLFTPGIADSEQWIGLFSDECGFAVGVKDGALAARHTTNGKRTIAELEVTSPATGSGDVTVTLNGEAFVVPMAIASIVEAVGIIEAWFNTNPSPWRAYGVGTSVYFRANHAEARGGAYTVGTTAAGFAGTHTVEVVGATPTPAVTLAPAFNGDTLNGGGLSGITLDVEKGNVWEIVFSYLGYGPTVLKMLHPTTRKWVDVHTWRFSNTQAEPNVSNPIMPIAIEAKTSAGVAVNPRSASVLIAIDGKFSFTEHPVAVEGYTTAVDQSPKSVLAIRPSALFDLGVKQRLLYLVSVEAMVEAGSGMRIRGFINPTFTTPQQWDVWSANHPHIHVSTIESVVTGGHQVASFTVAGGTSHEKEMATALINTAFEAISLQPGEVLAIQVESVAPTTPDTHLTVNLI